MQIPSNPYPVIYAPPASVPRRDDVRVDDETRPVSEPVQAAARRESSPAASLSLSADMRRAALRGRAVDGNSSFANRQAVATYAEVARRDEGAGQVEVLGFVDAYA